MIIIYNFILLCEYLINNAIGFTCSIYYDDDDDDDDDIEVPCYCNICYTLRNIISFATRRLKYKNV